VEREFTKNQVGRVGLERWQGFGSFGSRFCLEQSKKAYQGGLAGNTEKSLLNKQEQRQEDAARITVGPTVRRSQALLLRKLKNRKIRLTGPGIRGLGLCRK